MIEYLLVAGSSVFIYRYFTSDKPKKSITPEDLYNTKELSDREKLNWLEKLCVDSYVRSCKRQMIKAKKRGFNIYPVQHPIFSRKFDNVVGECLKKEGFIVDFGYRRTVSLN